MILSSLTLMSNSIDLPRFFPLRSGLRYLYVAAVQRNFWSIPYVLYTPQRSVEAMQQGFVFSPAVCSLIETGFFNLALARADLLRVGIQGGFSSLSFPDMTLMVGIYTNKSFRR